MFHDHIEHVLSTFIEILIKFDIELAFISFSMNKLCHQRKKGECGWIQESWSQLSEV